MVKVQFRGPELFKKKAALFQKESYLPRIFRSSSLNLHTFHLIHIVFWWQIFFLKHGKSTPNDRQDHHVLVVDVAIMTSQCRCTRALSHRTICYAWDLWNLAQSCSQLCLLWLPDPWNLPCTVLHSRFQSSPWNPLSKLICGVNAGICSHMCVCNANARMLMCTCECGL